MDTAFHRTARRLGRRPPWRLVVVLGLALVGPLSSARAGDEPAASAEVSEASVFLRFLEKDEGGPVLESAIVTYARDDGTLVHLVGALHIGERTYYDDLERTFETYDALLYELVKDKDATIEELYEARKQGGGPLGLVSAMQVWMKNMLELEFQLDGIDYRKKNFIHADLDTETFFSLQREKGESLFTLMLRAIKHDMERQLRGEEVAQITGADLLRVFLSRDRSREMKLVLGRQFDTIEASLAGLESEDGSVILTERNKAAMAALTATLAEGKRDIGVFYGAGHMQDLERRLLALGFRKVSQEWRVAWDMRDAADRRASPRAGAKTAWY